MENRFTVVAYDDKYDPCACVKGNSLGLIFEEVFRNHEKISYLGIYFGEVDTDERKHCDLTIRVQALRPAVGLAVPAVLGYVEFFYRNGER